MEARFSTEVMSAHASASHYVVTGLFFALPPTIDHSNPAIHGHFRAADRQAMTDGLPSLQRPVQVARAGAAMTVVAERERQGGSCRAGRGRRAVTTVLSGPP